MNLNKALFRQEISTHLKAIERICQRWGVPALATKMTLILRDPENAEMSLVLTSEDDHADAVRALLYLADRDAE